MKTTILLLTAALTTMHANAQIPTLNDLKSSVPNLNSATADLRALPAASAGAGIGLLAEAASGSGKNRIVVMGGPRLLTGERDSIRVEYWDESGSHDHMDKTIEVDGTSQVTTIIAYYERQCEKASFQTGIDAFFGNYWSAAFFVGGSYHLVNKDGFKIKTGARLSYGFGQVKLGDVQNNDQFFLIDGQKIYNEELRLTYKDNYVALSPSISIEKRIAGPIGILASLSGNVAVRTKSMIQFQGIGSLPLGAEKAEPAEIALNDVNLHLTRGGERIEKIPLNYTGASVTVGLFYTF